MTQSSASNTKTAWKEHVVPGCMASPIIKTLQFLRGDGLLSKCQSKYWRLLKSEQLSSDYTMHIHPDEVGEKCMHRAQAYNRILLLYFTASSLPLLHLKILILCRFWAALVRIPFLEVFTYIVRSLIKMSNQLTDRGSIFRSPVLQWVKAQTGISLCRGFSFFQYCLD